MRNLRSYEKKDSKPEFFRLSFRNCLSCEFTSDDRPCI